MHNSIFQILEKNALAGGNKVVEPVRNEAMFWHGIWMDNGRPHQDIIADIRRRTRAKYKHDVKTLNREQDTHISINKNWLLRFNHKINVNFGKK